MDALSWTRARSRADPMCVWVIAAGRHRVTGTRQLPSPLRCTEASEDGLGRDVGASKEVRDRYAALRAAPGRPSETADLRLR